MKSTTMIWYQFESVGQPRHTLKGQDTVGQALTILARWTLSVYMGAKIRVTFARDEIDLAPDRRTAGKHHDIMSDLESILNAAPTCPICNEPWNKSKCLCGYTGEKSLDTEFKAHLKELRDQGKYSEASILEQKD